MPWTISSTTNFLNALLALPKQVSKQFPKVIEILQENPVNRHAVKLKGYEPKILRIYLTKKYRLFYTYNDDCVKLLNIVKRDEKTYKDIEQINESEIIPFFTIDEGEFDNGQNYSTGLLSQSQLEQWLIPQKYWEDLLKIKNDDELLKLSIPEVYIERIIDNLYPKPLEEIQHKAEFSINSPEELDRFLSGEITSFLLKLNKKQEELLNFKNNGPILIKGGPGTGKSILALYKVKKLVDSKVRNILFTTHTPSLVNYSTKLLNSLLGRPLQEFGIEVNTVDNIVKRYYREQDKNFQIANDKISMFCLSSAINSIDIEESLHRRITKLGHKYLLEEILNVIEARGINTLDRYKIANRFGRRYPLDERMRQTIWEIYQQWKTLMKNLGYITIEELRNKALEIVSEQNIKPYQAVIIDEAQDLSPVALRFLVNLASSHQGIYLTADVAQSLYQRAFSWDLIQSTINFKGETKILTKSFRNTEQIGKACPEILVGTEFTTDSRIKNFSKLNGTKPKIILTDDILKLVQKIKDFFAESAQNFKLPIHSGAILLPDSDFGKLIAQQLTRQGLRAEYMEPQELDITKNCIKVLTLHSSKGLEFPFVAVVGLTEGILPQRTDHIPEDDQQEILNQERRLFYVGCSRAMRSLLVCGSKANRSQFLSSLMLQSQDYWEVEEIK